MLVTKNKVSNSIEPIMKMDNANRPTNLPLTKIIKAKGTRIEKLEMLAITSNIDKP